MARFIIERLDNTAFHLWDQFVRSVPGGSVFHTTEWLSLVAEDPLVTVVTDGNGEIRAGAAIGATRRFGVKGFFFPPYTAYFGPLYRPSGKQSRAAARTEVHQSLTLLLDALPRAAHLDFKLPPGEQEIIPYLHRGFTSSVRFTHEISGDYLDFERHLGRSPRYQLRKIAPLVDGGELLLEENGDPGEILGMLRETAGRRRFDRREGALKSALGIESDIATWETVIVRRQPTGQPLAGVLYLTDHARAYNLVDVSQPGLQGEEAGANLLCLDTAIHATLAQGKVFDLEGSLLPGVEFFYRRLGGTPRHTIRLQKTRSIPFFVARGIRQAINEMMK